MIKISEEVKVLYRMFLIEKGFVSEYSRDFTNARDELTIFSGRRNLKAKVKIFLYCGQMQSMITHGPRDYHHIYDLCGNTVEFVLGKI